MEKKETFKMCDEIEKDENIDMLNKGKLLFDIFIGSVPNFIDLLISKLKTAKLKKNQFCDVTITFNEFVNIIEPKINILKFFLSKLECDINITIDSIYPQTSVKFVSINKDFIQYLEDAKFLIYCEYHKNLGHA